MADLRQILTDKAVARLPYAKEKQYKVRDTEVAGFFVLIGKRSRGIQSIDRVGGMAFVNSPHK